MKAGTHGARRTSVSVARQSGGSPGRGPIWSNRYPPGEERLGMGRYGHTKSEGRLGKKGANSLEQNRLNRLQIVQFDCYKYILLCLINFCEFPSSFHGFLSFQGPTFDLISE